MEDPKLRMVANLPAGAAGAAGARTRESSRWSYVSFCPVS